MKKFLAVLLVVVFASALFAEGLVVGSPEWNKQKKALWDEYVKCKVAVDDTDSAPMDIQIETQQKKAAAAEALVAFGDRLSTVQGIAAWQYNNLGKLYINAFEQNSTWSVLATKLDATTDKIQRKAIKKELYEKANMHITFLNQAVIFLDKAKELNLLSPLEERTTKINNNSAYIQTVKNYVDTYKEE